MQIDYCDNCGTGYHCLECCKYICGHVSNLHAISCIECNKKFCIVDDYEYRDTCDVCCDILTYPKLK